MGVETGQNAEEKGPRSEEIARAAAGARGYAELCSRIEAVLGASAAQGERPVRLWLLRDGDVTEAATGSDAGGRTAPPPAVVEAAAAAEPVALPEGLLVGIRCEGTPLGALEIGDRSAAEAGRAIAETSEVIGARLQNLLDSERQQERLPNVPATSLAGEIDEVVSSFATQAQRLLPHDRLSIYLLTSDGEALERFAVASSPPIPGEQDIQPLETVGLARVIRTNEPIVSADFGTDERILGEHDSLIADAGFRGMVSVPLRHRGRPFGLLNFVSRTPGFYSEREAVVAQQIADQIAAFLRDLRQQQTIRDSLRRDAVRRERERVAREFHDTLAQALADISLRAELLGQRLESAGTEDHREAERIHEAARSSLEDVKRAIFDPVPTELRGSTLAAAMRRLVDRFRDETDVQVTLETAGELEGLRFEVKSTLLRTLREALANVRKHAGATTTVVAARADQNRTILTVRDDGGGFDAVGAEGFGITSMRADAVELGGTLELRSQPGGPTELELSLPLDEPAQGATAEPDAPDASYPPQVAARVLIVDDHPMFRAAVGELIGAEPGMRVVGEVGGGEECLGAVALLAPDVVLLDLSLPDMSGVEVARALREMSEPPTVLMVSAFAEGKAVADSLEAGARGYVTKTAPGEELIEAIRSAVRGATVLNATDWAQIADRGVELTNRELEILELVAAGARNSEVAEELHLATKTIEHAMARIVSKLDARNRTHAVAIAIETGLVSVAGNRAARG